MKPPAILHNTNENWVHFDEDKFNIFAHHLLDIFQTHNIILLPKKINVVGKFQNTLLQMSHSKTLLFS